MSDTERRSRTGAHAAGWHRIDVRSIPVEALPWLLHTYIGYLLFGSFFPPWVWAEVDRSIVLRGAVVVSVYGVVRAVTRWATSFYRVEGRRLSFRTGLFVRRRVTVERRLIRNVGLRSNAVAQLLGVTTVTASAAQFDDDVIVRIRSLPRADAAWLRDVLLGLDDREPETLMTGRPTWSLFAPFSSMSVSLWAGAYLLIYNVFFAWFAWIRTWYWFVANDVSWEQGVRWLLVVPIVVGVVGSVLLFFEAWWRYRLERLPAGVVRVSGGLVVRREVLFREDRLVGLEVDQPLPTRFAHRARVLAVATGAGSQRTLQLRLPGARHRILMPLGPPRQAHATVERVLGRRYDLTDLRPHPKEARAQRLRWAAFGALAATLLVFVALGRFAPGLVAYTWAVAAVLFVVAGLVALDNYRALGHRLTPDVLISRWGTWHRRTSLVDRDAITGWVFMQTYFQWRLGLMTMVASTAAGTGGYLVCAVGVDEGAALAREITPTVIDPLLRDPAASVAAQRAERAGEAP